LPAGDSHRGRLAAVLAFAAFVVLGVAIHRDYGVPVDERALRYYGAITASYVNQFLGRTVVPVVPTFPVPNLQEFDDRDHGAVVELLLAAVEGFPRLRYPQTLFARHLTVFAIFCLGLPFLHRTLVRRHGSWMAGLAGCAFLVLSPRIFGDAFYNSKDIPSLAAYAAAICTALGFVERPGMARALGHALASALAIAIRLPALVIPALTVVAALVHLASAPRNERHGAALMLWLGFYGAATVALVVVFWPTLWEHPVANALYAFRRLGEFPWRGTVLYRGAAMSASQLPWHYLPVWMLITTPPLFTLGFALGVLALVVARVRRGFFAPLEAAEQQDLFFLLAFAVPLLTVILGRSTVYDGWRHVYFVYPAFVCLAVSGLAVLAAAFRPPLARAVLLGAIGAACLATLVTMERLHPYEMLYFNFAAGRDAGARYDGDYWGLSLRRGLEEALRAEGPEGEVPVVFDGEGVFGNRLILPERDRERITLVPLPRARYYVTTHRETLYDPAAFRRRYGLAPTQQTYALVVGSTHVMSVYRLR